MKKKIKIAFMFLFCTITTWNCAKKLNIETEIYANNFDNSNLNNITGGIIESYNGSNVLGRYNNAGFELILNNLPKHELVEIAFDLYIHDTWDGNNIGDSGRNGPDIWKMAIDGESYIYTTFSNLECDPKAVFCPPQSYPFNYPNSTQNPKTGAYNKNLPGVCLTKGQFGGTSQYKIVKRIKHNGNKIVIQCLDKLVQTNTIDPMCDESWSIDNLTVKVIN